MTIIDSYKQYENSINMLQKPILIACKSARRAAAVVAAYQGVQRNKSIGEVTAEANEKKYRYLDSPGLINWVNESISILSMDKTL